MIYFHVPNEVVQTKAKTTGIDQTTIKIEWNHTFGGIYADYGFSLIQTSDNGIALAGTLTSDFCLIKIDAHDEQEWNTTYGGVSWDYARSLIQSSDGGYVLAGLTHSYGSGLDDMWLIKTNATGQQEWNTIFGGISNDYAYSVIQTSDGGFALAGKTESYGAGLYDMWLVKTNANGQQEWNATFGGINDDEAYTVIQTSDGGFLLAGSTASYGNGGFDMWLVKTNGNGIPEWNTTFGGVNDDRIKSLIRTTNSDFVLAGYTLSYGAGSSDMWLVKTNENGIPEWNTTFGGISNDYAISVIQTSDGGFALAGETESYGAGLYDMWLVKTNASGQCEWNTTFGGTGWDRALCVIQVSDRGLVLAGSTASYGAGSSDIWLVKTVPFNMKPTLFWTPSITFLALLVLLVKKRRTKRPSQF